MCSIDDADPPDVYRTHERRARKAHTCGECRRPIAPGELYRFTTGLSEGYWWSSKTCAHCDAAGHWLSVVCGGWLLEGLAEELRDHWDEGYRSAELVRAIVAMRRRWRNRAGELYPVPDRARVKASAERAMARMVAA